MCTHFCITTIEVEKGSLLAASLPYLISYKQPRISVSKPNQTKNNKNPKSQIHTKTKTQNQTHGRWSLKKDDCSWLLLLIYKYTQSYKDMKRNKTDWTHFPEVIFVAAQENRYWKRDPMVLLCLGPPGDVLSDRNGKHEAVSLLTLSENISKQIRLLCDSCGLLIWNWWCLPGRSLFLVRVQGWQHTTSIYKKKDTVLSENNMDEICPPP